MALTAAETKDQPKPSDLRLLILAEAPTQTNTENLSTDNSTPTTQSLPQTSPIPAFLEALTTVHPPPTLTTFSGYTSHPVLPITTKYFSTKVTLWCDEFSTTSTPATTDSPTTPTPSSTPSIAEWTQTLLTPPAQEVREAIGALTLLLPFTHSQLSASPTKSALLTQWLTHIETLDTLCETIEDETGRSLAKILVLQDVTPGNARTPKGGDVAEGVRTEMEDRGIAERGLLGWDFVLFGAGTSTTTLEGDADERGSKGEGEAERENGRNEFGEEKGMKRVLEVLRTVDWTQKLSSTDDAEDEFDYDYELASTEDIEGMLDGVDPVTQQSHEFRREIADLHFALDNPRDIAGAGDEDGMENGEGAQVDQLAGLIDRVVAIREAGAEMGKEEREKFAKREVAKIMREMG